MDRTHWQIAAAAHLLELHNAEAAPSLERRAAAILTPLLEAVAAAQAAGDSDALVDLSFLPGEVTGGNLLGRQLRRWSSHTPQQLAAALTDLSSQAEWKAEIDELLAAFDATEFQRVDSKPKPEAQVINQPGQSVQGNQQNITGTVTGPVIAGDVGQIGDIISPDPAKERAADAERAYLRRLRRESNALPLAQDSRAAGDPDKGRKTPQLANVYVDLQTDSRPSLEQVFDRLSIADEERRTVMLRLQRELADGRNPRKVVEPEVERLTEWLGRNSSRQERERISQQMGFDADSLKKALQNVTALEALAAHPRLVLLGDPGGGKSTFVNHLAYLCAGAHLGEEAGWQARLDNLFPAPLLPLRVIVRRWSSRLRANGTAGAELVYAALMEETKLERDALLQRLNAPDTLVLLDGLDEAPPADPNNPPSNNSEVLDRRRTIVESVEAFCDERPACRVLVTCRVKPYETKAYQLSEIRPFTLAELDAPRVERFLGRWYGEMARTGSSSTQKAEADREQLQSALKRRGDLQEMAATPLLLTMLARVNARSGLPDNRADLYHECVEQLLWEWEAAKSQDGGQGGGERTGLVDLLNAEGAGLKRGDLERVLWEMTFAAHAQSGAETADLPAASLRQKLASVHPKADAGWAWANRVVRLMAERSGLLVDTGVGTFTFPHRTFQEYLAARWLLEQEDCPQRAALLAESDKWREVILLACGYATSNSAYNKTQAILFELIGDYDLTSEGDCLRLLTAGQGWLEFGPHRAVGATGERLKREMPPLLTRLMQSRDVPPKQRLEAGLILADLHILPDDLDEFVELPPTEAVPYAFKIGKYPVTNAQYRRFVEAGGYDEGQLWWTEEAVAELDRFASDWRAGPGGWDYLDFNRGTQPVFGISWYETVAYCTWLSGELRRQGRIGTDQGVRLPSEAEWERTARSSHGQDYPWGDDFDPGRANTSESNLDQTSPVHQYPDGVTPDGVWDLAGNALEWTGDVDRDGRVPLCGGLFSVGANEATASARGYGYSRRRNYLVGFRVVVVPISYG